MKSVPEHIFLIFSSFLTFKKHDLLVFLPIFLYYCHLWLLFSFPLNFSVPCSLAQKSSYFFPPILSLWHFNKFIISVPFSMGITPKSESQLLTSGPCTSSALGAITRQNNLIFLWSPKPSLPRCFPFQCFSLLELKSYFSQPDKALLCSPPLHLGSQELCSGFQFFSPSLFVPPFQFFFSNLLPHHCQISICTINLR